MRLWRRLLLGLALIAAYRATAFVAGLTAHEFLSMLGGDLTQTLAACFALLGLTAFGFIAVWLVDRLR